MRLHVTPIVALLLAGCGGFGGAGFSVVTSGSTKAPTSAATGLPQGVQLQKLVIETSGLSISQPGFAQQLQATGMCSDGHVRDLTRFVTWSTKDTTVGTVDAKGIAHPVGAGSMTVQCSELGLDATATVEVMASAVTSGTTTTPPPASGPTFHADVFPLFQSKLTCTACHAPGGIGATSGRMVVTGVEATDYTTFTTKGLIDTSNPPQSLCIQKGTGAVSHAGGTALQPGSPDEQTILSWIGGGAPLDAATTAGPSPVPSLPVPDALLVSPAARNLVDANAEQQLVVLAWYSAAGTVVDVTRFAAYSLSMANVATVDSNGLVHGTGPGSVTLTVGFEGVQATSQLGFGAQASVPNGDAAAAIQLPAKGTTLAGTAPRMSLLGGDGQMSTPGSLLAQPLAIAVMDAGGHPVANVPVTFAVTAGGGSLTTTATKTDASGKAQTSLMLGAANGANTVTATAAGSVANSPVTFNETSKAIVPPTLSIVSGDAQMGTTSAPLAPFVVVLKDSAGAPVAGSGVSFTIASAGGGSLSTLIATTDATGQASTILTLPGTPGTTTVTASVSGATNSPATFTATASPPSIAVASGNNQSAPVKTVLAPMVATLLDGTGKPYANQTVTFAIASGNGTLSATSAKTGATGQASSVLTLPATPGSVVVTASSPGATGSPAIFVATATAGAPASIAVVSGTPQTSMVSTTLMPFVAVVKDSAGNPLMGQTVTFAIASGAGTLSAASAATNASGQAATTLTLPAVAGTTTVNATVTGVATPAVFTATATAAAPPTLTIVSGNNQTGLTGTKLASALVVLLKNGQGAVLANTVVSFAASSGTLSATSATTDTTGQAAVTFTLGAAGTNTVTASYTGASAVTFNETAQALPTISIASGNNQTAAPSTALPLPLVVLVKDGAGNPVAGAPVTFAVTAGGGTLSATAATTNASGQAQTTLTLGSGSNTTNSVSASTPNGAAGVTFTEMSSAPAALSWATNVYPLFKQSPLSCTGCHDAGGPGRFKLTGNAATDYTAIVQNTSTPLLVNTASPSLSYILEKGAQTNGVVHGGGSRMSTTSTQYTTILNWIQQGAKP